MIENSWHLVDVVWVVYLCRLGEEYNAGCDAGGDNIVRCGCDLTHRKFEILQERILQERIFTKIEDLEKPVERGEEPELFCGLDSI